jgi:hypothetical protein
MLISRLKNGNNTLVISFLFLLIRLLIGYHQNANLLFVVSVFIVHGLTAIIYQRTFSFNTLVKKQSRIIFYVLFLLGSSTLFYDQIGPAILFLMVSSAILLLFTSKEKEISKEKLFKAVLLASLTLFLDTEYLLFLPFIFIIFLLIKGMLTLQNILLTLFGIILILYTHITFEVTILDNVELFSKFINSITLNNQLLIEGAVNWNWNIVALLAFGLIGIFDLIANLERKSIVARQIIHYFLLLFLVALITLLAFGNQILGLNYFILLLVFIVLVNYLSYLKSKWYHDVLLLVLSTSYIIISVVN